MRTKVIKIKPPTIRLDQLLKLSGEVSSGGEAKHLIFEGEVTVNGDVCVSRGRKIKDGDQVSIREDCCLSVCYEAD